MNPFRFPHAPCALSMIVFLGVLCCCGDFSTARAELSQKFLHNLQKQYENGHIPDPAKDMSYEEKLAIRKKQQKLAEDQRKKAAIPPPPPPPPPREDPRYRPDDRNDSPRDQAYERTYRYCRQRWGYDQRGFSECMHENLRPSEWERERDWPQDNNYNDRYRPY